MWNIFHTLLECTPEISSRDCKHWWCLVQSFFFRKGGVTLSNLLHIFFDSYSANTKNINLTTLKVSAIIQKHTIFSISANISPKENCPLTLILTPIDRQSSSVANVRVPQFTTHYFDFKSKKLYWNRCRSNDLPKINRKCAENES